MELEIDDSDLCICGHTKLVHNGIYDLDGHMRTVFDVCNICFAEGTLGSLHDFKLDNFKYIERHGKRGSV